MLYLLGGWAPGSVAFPYTHSQVWKSLDGANWQRLADAPWEGRHTAGWLTHDSKLWVIGGDVNSGHYQYDVWRGTPNGSGDIDWVQVSADATPLAEGRTLHQVFSHDGKMWLVGGQTLDDLPAPTGPVSDPSTKPGSPYYDDVWSSTDGATWTQVSSGNLWAPCGLIMGSPVKDGYMWLVAGGAYDTKGNPRVYKSSVWRSADGVTWTEVTSDGGFPPRQYNNVAVLGTDLVLSAGYDGDNIADAWASPDGADWRQLAPVPWTARHAASVVEFNGELLLLGGPLAETSVWAMR